MGRQTATMKRMKTSVSKQQHRTLRLKRTPFPSVSDHVSEVMGKMFVLRRDKGLGENRLGILFMK